MKNFVIVALVLMVACLFVPQQVEAGGRAVFVRAPGVSVNVGRNVGFFNRGRNVVFINSRRTPVRNFLFGRRVVAVNPFSQQVRFNTFGGFVQPQFFGVNPGFVDPSFRFIRTGNTVFTGPQFIGGHSGFGSQRVRFIGGGCR